MEAKAVNFKTAKGIKSAFLVIVCCFILAVCVFHFVLGDPANFMNNDPNNHPLPGNFKGTIYKGGTCRYHHRTGMEMDRIQHGILPVRSAEHRIFRI